MGNCASTQVPHESVPPSLNPTHLNASSSRAWVAVDRNALYDMPETMSPRDRDVERKSPDNPSHLSKSEPYYNVDRRDSLLSRHDSIHSATQTPLSSGSGSGSGSGGDTSTTSSKNSLSHYIDNPAHTALPRIVFVNVYALYAQWSNVDPLILFNSIVIINGNRSDLFCAERDFHDSVSPRSGNSICSGSPRFDISSFTLPFIQFLTYKDKQKLIVYLQDCQWPMAAISSGSQLMLSSLTSIEEHGETCVNLIHPLWHKLSQDLSAIVDPFRQCHFSEIDWNNPQYDNIQFELRNAEFKSDTLIHVLSKCNPTLIPMIHFDIKSYIKTVQWLVLRFGSGSY